MGQSKDLLIDENEICNVEMTRQFYEDHFDILQPPNTRIKSAYIKNKSAANDKLYKQKMDALIEAKNNLIEYEVEMKYKTYKK